MLFLLITALLINAAAGAVDLNCTKKDAGNDKVESYFVSYCFIALSSQISAVASGQ